LTLTAAAADNVGVAGVQFLVNGYPLTDEYTNAPYTLTVPTTADHNGSYTLTAVARDVAGNITTSAPVSITVDNTAPTVSLTAPSSGTVSGVLTLTAAAADNVGVADVQFLVNDTVVLAEDPDAPYTLTVPTTPAHNGTYTLTAVARDAAGNTTTSAPVTITVANAANNHAPVITWSAGVPDPITAAVTGSLTFSDPDGDGLIHTISQPYSGTLDFNAATGVFTYIPSYDTRVQYALWPESGVDFFRVGVSDGFATTQADVSVLIGTGQLPPIGYGEPPEVRSADPATGTVTGGLNLFDPNGDTLTYTVVQAPARGTASIDASGIYSYIPNVSARAAGGVDSFTVALSDGTGSTTVNVTVPIRAIELASIQTLIPNVGGPVAVSGSRAYYVGVVAYNGAVHWTVEAVDTDTDTVIAESGPIAQYGWITPDVAVSPDGTRVYLANPTTGPEGQKIYVLDGGTLSQAGAPISVGTWPTVIAVSPNGTRLYVGNEIDDNVQVFDTSTRDLVATIPIGSAGYLTDMVISPDGSRVYIADGAYNKVTVVDADNNTVLGPMVGSWTPNRDPAAIALNPDGQRLYVASPLEGAVSVFDTATWTLVDTPIPVGVPHYLGSTILRPTGITVSSDGLRVYVARADDIVVIDAASRAVVGAIRVDQPPPDMDWRNQNIFIGSDGDVYVNVYGGVKAVNVGATDADFGALGATTTTTSGFAAATGATGVQPVSLTAAADTTAPTVSLTSPVSGFVSGAVTISADAADDVGVEGVQFLVNGYPLTDEYTTAPYTLTMPTTADHNGSYTLSAVARDAAGNTTTSAPVSITVDNTAPTVSLTAPSSGPVSGALTLTAAAADNVGVAGVQFLVNGYPLTDEYTNAPYTLTVPTTPAHNGTYTLTARARDVAGNITTSAPVSITVDNTAPTVSLTAPAHGATVSGALTLTAAAADNVAVEGVQFLVNGYPLGDEYTTAPYTLTVNTTPAHNGTYTLTAVARDTSGNTTTSQPVTITVANTGQILVSTTAIDIRWPATGQPISPTAVAISGNRAYVYGGDVITVIDTTTNTVIESTALYNDLPAITGGRKYVANGSSVDVVNAATNAFITNIPVVTGNSTVRDVVVSRDGTRVYVNQPNQESHTTVVSTIDTVPASPTYHQVVDFATVPVFNDMEVNQAGTIYGAQGFDQSNTAYVRVLDTGLNPAADVPLTSLDPTNYSQVLTLAMNPDATRAYAVVYSHSGLWSDSVIDTDPSSPTYNTEIAMITERSTALSPDGSRRYVAQSDGNKVVVFDTATNTAIGTFTTDQSPAASFRSIAVAPNGTLYITDPADSKVYAVTVGIGAAPTQQAPNQSTGAITGSINGSDENGDTLSYTVTGAPANGTVNLNPTSGAFTYTPTQAARFAADMTMGADFDSFTVGVSDGTKVAPVRVNVAALPARILDPVTSAQLGVTPMGVAVSSTKSYVANQGSNTVSVIDRSNPTGTPVTINVVSSPRAIALSDNGAQAYVAGNGGVSVINTANNQVITTVSTTAGDSYGIAVVRTGVNTHRVYVTNAANNTVRVINADTLNNTYTPGGSVQVGSEPTGIAVSGDGTRAYVANWASNNVSVLNITAATPTVIRTVAVGTNPVGVAVSPNGATVYVSNYGSNTVSVLDPIAANPLVTTIGVDAHPFGLAISPDGSLLYAANELDTISMITTKNNSVYSTLTFDPQPEPQLHSIAVSPDGNQIYFSDLADRRLRVFTVLRGNTAPIAGTPTVGAPAASNGAVTGALNFTDTDGDALTSYSVQSQPASGTVTVNAAGVYTFTPTQPGRDAAAQTEGADFTSFTVVASDGQLATPVTVGSIQIAPTPRQPQIAATMSSIGVGDRPGPVAVFGNRLYVTNTSDGMVTVIDTGTNQVVKTLTATSGYVTALAATADGQTVYVARYNTVSVVNVATDQLVTDVAIPDLCAGVCWGSSNGLTDLAMSPDGSRVYVVQAYSTESGPWGSVAVIDTSDDSLIYNEFSAYVTDLEYTPDGTQLLYTQGDYRFVHISDFSTGQTPVVQVSTPEPGWAIPLAVATSPDPDHRRAYVVVDSEQWDYTGAKYVAVIDLERSSPTYATQIGTIAVPPGAQNIVIGLDGRAFVTHSGGESVTVIDTATDTVIGHIATSHIGGYFALAVAPNGKVYMTDYADDVVYAVTVDNPVTGAGAETRLVVDDAVDLAAPLALTAAGSPLSGVTAVSDSAGVQPVGLIAAAVADTTAPTLSLTSPAGGPVRGAVTLSADAADDVGVEGVQFLVNGFAFGEEYTTAPYTLTAETTADHNGTYTLSAVARDAAGNTTTSAPVTITVDNTAPTVSLTAPPSGTVSGELTLTAAAADNVGVEGVQFLVNGALFTEHTTAPYTLTAYTTAAHNGTYTLTAVARDAAGNTTTSAPVTITIANETTPPTVSLTSPPSGPVRGALTLIADAVDDFGVAGVQFLVNGYPLGDEDTIAGYTLTVNTTAAHNGTYTLTALARDISGNTTTSAPVTITVDNTAPTVSLTGPAAGATVSGMVNLTAAAADNVGVARVQFVWQMPSGCCVQNVLLAEDTTAPYGPVSWDTTAAFNGPNTLIVRAFDAAGNTTSTPVTVRVANPANNRAPVVPGKTIPGGPDPVTGVVTGRMNVQDPDQDPLTYTLAAPPSQGGTVTFNQPTGVFTYTPSQAARDQAATTSELDYDTFWVSASDGIATVQTSVRVQVAQTLPPALTVTNAPVTAGSGPSGAAVAGGHAYVINYDSNNVTVINTATNQSVATLAVGAGPLSVAANPQHNRVYVSNSLANTVSVIDATTNTLIGSPIPINVLPGSYYNPEVSYYPLAYANRVTEVAAVGNRLYVNATDGRITVIDTTNDTNSFIRADGLGVFQDLKVSPDGTRLYGTTLNGGLTVINTSTMTATGIPIGPAWNSQLFRNEYVDSVGSVTVSPDGKRAYVTFGATIAERGVGGQSNGSFFTRDGLTWMETGGYSGVSVIDTDPTSANFNKEIARTIVPLGVHDVAASGTSLYITSGDGKTVTVMNTANNTLTGIFTTDQIASGGRAIAIMVYPYGEEYPEYGIPVVGITAFTRYVTVGPTGTVYVTDYTDGKAYAVTVGSSSM
jgi:YVTN family beta-propeller protein/VCBS repeat-containing protein